MKKLTIEILSTLSDRAIALHCALEMLGTRPTIDDLMRVRHKSKASIYRALPELKDAGFDFTLSPCKPQEPPPSPPKRRRYC